MIDHLDYLLRRLLRNRITQLTTDNHVRFQPPDEEWRKLVANMTGNAVNLYLVDLRENRKLRTNERERRTVGLDVFETQPPRRVDCHYLLSAWSPVTVTMLIDPTPDEHALLADAARALGEHDELDPVAIYAASTPPAVPPAAIAGERFPITLLPVEGFAKLGEFWGTMGDGNRWKPCVYFVVTVTLHEADTRSGPMVTTAMAETRVAGEPSTAQTLMQFGGTLRASGAPGAAPVDGAWVDLRTTAGARRQLVRTGADGRFLFVQIPPGSYLLQVSATGFAPFTAAIDVPSPGGGYDMHF
ncbi:MAG: Pvc16 family protein [Pseudomonadota bacterium]